jgi:hypothetical protein
VVERRRHTVWLGFWAAAYALAAAAQPPARVLVVELLRALMAGGVNVLYSSELVPPSLDAPDAAPGGELFSRVISALAANGLTLQQSGERSFVVTRIPTPPAPSMGAGAAGARPPTKATNLDEISVFASRYEFTSSPSGEPTGFDEQALEQAPGAKNDALRALQNAPGLAGNMSARPYVRGALLDDVLVEYDGIALAEPFHFRNFQSVMSVFNPSTVNRADVYTGGFPVNYGTRSGGVIDLTPRALESGYEYAVGANFLSYDLETVGHAATLPLDWLLVARHSSDDRVLKRLLNDEGEPSFYDLVGRIRWSVDPTAAISVGWLLLQDQVSFTAEAPEEFASGHARDLTTWLRWDWAPAAALRAQTALAVATSERNNTGNLLLPGLAQGSLRAERSFTTLGLHSDWTYAASPALRLNFGGEFARENAELAFVRNELFTDALAASFGRPLDASIFSNQSPHSSTASVYASAHRRWQAFEAELGVRFDAQAYQAFGARSQLTPRVNVRYDLSDRWHAYGSWGEFSQAQRVDEYRTEAHQTTPDPANRAVHVIGGVAFESADSFSWRAEAYRHHWSTISPYFANALGPVSLVPQLGPDRVLVTPADADAAGLELSAQGSFSRRLSAWGSYTLSNVTDDSNGEAVLRSWDQTHSAKFGIAWKGGRNELSALLGWHSGWPRTPIALVPATMNDPAYFKVGARNSARWGSFFSADLRVSTSVTTAAGELSLWLDGTNLTNRPNACCVDDLDSVSAHTGESAADNMAWTPRVLNIGFEFKVRRPQ